MRRRNQTLSAEDRAVWNQVAATATPLHPERPSSPSAAPRPAPVKTGKDRQRHKVEFELGENAPHRDPGHQLAPSVADRVNEAPVKMHRSTYQKMQRGKLKPEARIDLHGLTLAEAHPRLNQFILSCHASGLRLVLVITGKGRDSAHDGPIPIRRGVLRHQVPMWLHTPPLGAVVLDIRTAHQRHGGEGAYYVYLKRQR